MKIYLTLFASLFLFTIKAVDRKSLPSGSYTIISDEYSSILQPGECVVRGKIQNPNYYSDDQIPPPISGAYVGTLDGKRFTYSNEKGEYSLVLKEGDTSIYMFAKEYQEVVIWKYNFKSQHVVNIDFYAYSDYNMIEVDKPVIYCYAENTMDINITIQPKGELTFTYPEYENMWSVNVNQNGIQDKKSGREYPYLFWEAETNELDFTFNQNTLPGELIQTDTLIEYLENTLSAMGLNETEQTDFITFWAPRMVENEFVLVQFLLNEEYDSKISKMEINPTPDSMLRVYMLYAPVETDQSPFVLEPVSFKPFERNGFTVVEWGGSELPFIDINP